MKPSSTNRPSGLTTPDTPLSTPANLHTTTRPRFTLPQHNTRVPFDHGYAGDPSGGALPDPIPNSVVKPSSADGTARETVWESRSSPAPFRNTRQLELAGVARFALHSSNRPTCTGQTAR